MMRGAHAARTKAQLARVFLRVFDELGDALYRQIIVDHKEEGYMRKHRDRLEILHRVVADFFVESWIDCQCRASIDQQRVAIRCGPRDGIDADLLASPRAILDDERFAEASLKRGRRHTTENVGGSRGRERNDDGDGACRIILGGCRWHTGNYKHDCKKWNEPMVRHLPLPILGLRHCAPRGRERKLPGPVTARGRAGFGAVYGLSTTRYSKC